jgi:RHS repeat-associated protein
LSSSELLSEYGSPGSTYQTEIANFSNVTASTAVAGGGPSYFTVQGKDGLTYEYGNTADSKIIPAGATTPYVWALDKVTDRSGNEMTFTYLQGDGAYVPLSIQYTAPNGSTTFPYQVKFTYTPKSTADISSKFIAGSQIQQTNQLSTITVTSSGTIVRQYNLSYTTSVTTSRATLTSIQECANPTGAGGTASDCLPATNVGYQSGALGIANPATPSGASNADGPVYSVDINGDGRKDLVYGLLNKESRQYSWYIQLATATGYGAVTTTELSGAILLDDLDATGQTDLINNGTVYKWNGTGFTTTTIAANPPAGSQITFADIDGDGRPDLVSLTVNGSSSILAVYFNTTTSAGISFATTPGITQTLNLANTTFGGLYGDNNSSSGNLPMSQNSSLSHFDFNGDGRSDLLLVQYTSNDDFSGWFAYELAYNGNAFAETGGASLGNGSVPNPFVALNFNDDACTDLMGTTELQISECNGDGFLDLYIPTGTAQLAVDWDGDGRTDILANVGGVFELYRSEGNQFATGVSTGISVASGTWAVTDQNGDGLDDLVFANTGATLYYSLHNGIGTPPDLANSFSDAYGNSETPSYASIVESSYTEQSTAVFPNVNYIGPLYVVNEVVFSDPTDPPSGTYNEQFKYYGGWENLQGRGFLGFSEKVTSDSRYTGTYIPYHYEYFSQAFPYTGMKIQDLIAGLYFRNEYSFYELQTTNTPAVTNLDATPNNQRYFPYVSSVSSDQFEVGGADDGDLVTLNSLSFSYDGYGNVIYAEKVVTDEDPNSPFVNDTWTSTTQTTIAPDTSTWCLSVPTKTEVTNSSTAPNGAAITRTVTYTPDYTNCRISGKITAPGTSYQVSEAYQFDSFGNVKSDAVTGTGMTTRTTGIYWGSSGQFPTVTTNALNQSITLEYDPNTGNLLYQTDPNYTATNPLQTSWAYDDFGRKIKETRPDGTYTTWAYNNCASSGGCLLGTYGLAVFHEVIATNGAVIQSGTTDYDALDRPVLWNKLLINGTYDLNEVKYDNLGRMVARAEPCAWGGSATTQCPYWISYNYDILNRITAVQRPISATNNTAQTTVYGYSGRTATVTDPYQVTITRINYATGQLAQSRDPNGYVQNLSYDAFGSLVSVTDSASPVNTLFKAAYSYGLGAFKTSSTDMDMGYWQFFVDPLGEVTNWIDAKNQSFSQSYDLLSRPYVRTEPDLTTQWSWGTSTSAYNIGKLASVTSAGSTGTYSEAYSYESKTRLSEKSISIPGDAVYSFSYAYSPTTGLLSQVSYPAMTSPAYQLSLNYGYAYGVLTSVKDANSGAAYWTANATNPRGQVTQETLGNGVVTNRTFDAVTSWIGSIQSGLGGEGAALLNSSYGYDENGDLIQRQNNNIGLTENFYYDSDYRLHYSTLNGVQNLWIGYDTTGMGNIAQRTDVGSGTAWQYDPVRKHAVTQTGSGGFGVAFTYDANGNATSRNGFPATWTSYNYLSGIGSSGESVAFQYGPNRQRWQTVYTGSIGTETTYHVGGLLEKVVNGGTTTYRHYIYGGDGLAAVYNRTTAGSNILTYALEDHQGSMAELVTNSSPGPVTDYVSESFTAFGNRRSGETWSGAPSTADETSINSVTRDGYTGQTALGVSMGLNHFNGRVQDANTGRFLSPDPNVPDPYNTQSYNRYSYVNNNPLSETDPSGFFNLGDLLNPFSNSNPFNPFGSFGRSLAFSGLTTNYALFRFGQKQGDSVLRHETWLQPIAQVAACYFGGEWGCAAASSYLTRLNGGSVDQALLAGALTFASSEADFDTGSWATDALVKGVWTGDVAAIEGGNFSRGFELGAIGSLALSGYQYITAGYSPDVGPGQVQPQPTDDSDCGPGWSCYKFTDSGHVPDYAAHNDVFGDNSREGWCPQSGTCSQIANAIPTLNAVALAHDNIIIQIQKAFGLTVKEVLNFPTMIPALIFTEAAVAGEYPVPLLSTRH